MTDLISRQAAIEAIKQSTIHSEDESLAVEALGELPSAQPEQRWIPVSERLPEAEESYAWMFGETTYYLVTEEQGWMYLAKYIKRHDGRCEWDDDDGYIYSKNVTAWMPLPDPYGGEE